MYLLGKVWEESKQLGNSDQLGRACIKYLIELRKGQSSILLGSYLTWAALNLQDNNILWGI